MLASPRKRIISFFQRRKHCVSTENKKDASIASLRKTKKGMYGFDSKMNCHVSMSSLAVTLVNLDCKKLIGENNYALAA